MGIKSPKPQFSFVHVVRPPFCAPVSTPGRRILQGDSLYSLITHHSPQPPPPGQTGVTQVRDNNAMLQFWQEVHWEGKERCLSSYTNAQNRGISWGQHPLFLAHGKCSGASSLLVYHSIPVLALINGRRVTKFSIKRKVTETHFQEGIPKPHSGVEPSIQPTWVGYQFQTAGGMGKGGPWVPLDNVLVIRLGPPPLTPTPIPHCEIETPENFRAETPDSSFWSGHLPKAAGRNSR